MFRKIFIGLFVCAVGMASISKAQAACSIPVTLANGTTADATQVMTNFNSLAGCAAPLASPSFTGSLALTGTLSNPGLNVQATIGSANVQFKANSGGEASLTLDGATGYASQIYNVINGAAIWASGVTGNGTTNSYAWYNYTGGGTTFYLSTNGNAALAGCLTYNGGTLGTCLSDSRTKKNILPFHTGLQQIAALTPVIYQYNGLGDTDADGKVRTGLVAQDVEAVAPELVQSTNAKLSTADKSGKPLMAVKYGDLTFALINAVKELKAENDNQATELAQLKRQVASLRVRVERAASTR